MLALTLISILSRALALSHCCVRLEASRNNRTARHTNRATTRWQQQIELGATCSILILINIDTRFNLLAADPIWPRIREP